MVRFYETDVGSRLMLGTARYPSLEVMADAIRASEAEIVTVSVRREAAAGKEGQEFWQLVRGLGLRMLPNTAGCFTVKEAVTTAHMAREIFDTPWIKLEVIGDRETLQPDMFGTVEAARILTEDGFQVFPYTTEDLIAAEKLMEVGCQVLMPWGAPIGTGLGLANPHGLQRMRQHFPDTTLVVDAGIGLPSHATQAMEAGYDAILLSTAVGRAGDPVKMGRAMRDAVYAGRQGWEARPMPVSTDADPSTPMAGKAKLA